MYSQITPMEIDILFQLADCRHPDGSVATGFSEVVCVCCTLLCPCSPVARPLGRHVQ